jgi:anaerobic magnesium-protoporphyrin IX monomethyl ester cyclase
VAGNYLEKQRGPAVQVRTLLAEVISVVKETIGAIPFVTTSFVWGFPGETYDDFRETVDLLLYLAAHGASPQFNLLVPYSYSTLFGRYRDQLLFQPQYSSQLRFYSDGEEPWCTSMVASRPDLFSVFYRLPTGDFEQKWAYLLEHGIDTLDWQREYFASAAETLSPVSG